MDELEPLPETAAAIGEAIRVVNDGEEWQVAFDRLQAALREEARLHGLPQELADEEAEGVMDWFHERWEEEEPFDPADTEHNEMIAEEAIEHMKHSHAQQQQATPAKPRLRIVGDDE